MKRVLGFLCTIALLLGFAMTGSYASAATHSNVSLDTRGHATVSTTPSASSPYGITIINRPDNQAFNCTSAQDFQDLGATWARIQISWSDIEQSKGQYTWTLLDSAVSCARQRGVLIDFPIQNAPSWRLSQCPDPKTGLPQLPGPSDESGFAQQLVNHIISAQETDVIQAIEVGNEEWSYVSGTCQNNPSVYIPVLEKTYTVIKNAIPGMLVGYYGYTNYTSAQNDVLPYWNAVFSDPSNPAQYMDYANFHYYDGGGDPNQLGGSKDPYNDIWQAIHTAALNNHHGNKPIWTTETGWHINNNYGRNSQTCVTEQNQSDYELEMLADGQGSGGVVTHIFFYTMDESNDGMSLTQAQNPPTLCSGRPLNLCTGPQSPDVYYTAAYCNIRNYIQSNPGW